MLFWAATVALAALLALHVRMYWFLTDDAFISFRYARNLAEGAGLVFNRGDEHVEGYTNFLWVILLAALVRAGLDAEQAAPWLSVAATGAVWWGTILVGWRLQPPRWRCALALVAPLVLAANRSFAVWSTGGLETRAVELLLFAGFVVLYREFSLHPASLTAAAVSGLLFAAATLVRPDALLIAAGALAARDILLGKRHRTRPRAIALRWVALAAPVAAHLAWRLWYYGYPLPNTYYAKLSDQRAIAEGLWYVVFFVVEYGLVCWVPFAIGGVRTWRRQAPGLATLSISATVPYLAYVVYAGGDHFELRSLDVFWVPLVLLFQAGLAYWVERARHGTARLSVCVLAGAAIAASALLPWLAHRDHPREHIDGFPGFRGRSSGDRNLIRPESAPAFLRLPVLRSWLDSYNELARRLTSHYVALRQETHKQTAEITTELGLQLRRFVDQGYLPEDTRIAINAVGAIPYYSRLWTLDRLGLCDVRIAHSPAQPGPRMAAHSKVAWPSYIAVRGVDLNSVHPYSFVVRDETVLRTRGAAIRMRSENYFVARLGPDTNFLVHFPQGPTRSLARFPNIRFRPVTEWEPSHSH